MQSDKIRVLIIDDSILHRQAFSTAIGLEPDMEVIATAENGKEGVEKALRLRPDVITMDIQMPVMNGIEAISIIMYEIPTPIIVISALDNDTVAETLRTGAMDLVTISQDIDYVIKELIEKIKVASKVKPIKRMKAVRSIKDMWDEKIPTQFKVIAIGSSTGGPIALSTLLSGLPHNFPAAVLISQHISKGFMNGLITYLQNSCHMEIQLATPDTPVQPGKVIIAPDDAHLEIDGNGRIQIIPEKEKNLIYAPSINLMMTSVANNFTDRAIGVIMTGMGNDGVNGIKAIKQAGGFTIAQDEKTSAIFGMNKAAIKTGFVDKVMPLDMISVEIVDSLKAVSCIDGK